MPRPHSPIPHNATPNPEPGQCSSKTQGTRQSAHHSLLDISHRPTQVSPCLCPPLFPISSPLPSARAPAFHFPFTVSNLTSPLSAFRLFLCSALFLPLSCLQPYSRSTDYLFYFRPINSSGMVPGGKPTATKPPAVDTSHTDSLLSFQHPVF